MDLEALTGSGLLMPATEALAEKAAVFVAGERPLLAADTLFLILTGSTITPLPLLLAELEELTTFSLAQDFPEGTFEVDF